MADENDFCVECMRLSAISTSIYSPSKSRGNPASTPPCGNLVPNPQQQYSIDDFELIEVLGRGSYAKVLMVELKQTKRAYAMKVIKKTKIKTQVCINGVRAEKDVFLTASEYPFLVGLHSCFQTPSRLFFVMEFVRGGTLLYLMKRERRLPEESARFYAAEISLALNYLHEHGIIYRDLKLDNVLLDHEGHIKLTDYGLCKVGFAPGDIAWTMCGTPQTVAPEVLNSEGYGFGVDWWALGVIMYEMLVGRSPFWDHSMSTEYVCKQILKKLIRIPSSLSPEAASVLESLLDRNPEERLGCGTGGFMEIVKHPFFKIVQWEMLEEKRVYVPFIPELEGDRDLKYFPDFSPDEAQLTPDLDKSFDGFEYVNPLMASLEEHE